MNHDVDDNGDNIALALTGTTLIHIRLLTTTLFIYNNTIRFNRPQSIDIKRHNTDSHSATDDKRILSTIMPLHSIRVLLLPYL